jgi:hypothetical protein
MNRHLGLAAWFARFCAIAAVSGQGSFASAETVKLSTGDCTKLVQHRPADDVTYKPGVDVRGKAVAPADLGGGYNMQIPDEINIQIGIDLADRLALRDARKNSQAGAGAGLPAQTPVRKVLPYSGTAPIGQLTVKGNDIYWNGERIAPQDEALLAEACSKGLTAAGVPLPSRKPAPPKP